MSQVVYLLHFARPLGGRASHYIGTSTVAGLAARLDAHRHGRGARITAAANREDIAYILIRTWPGGRSIERLLKAGRMRPGCVQCVTTPPWPSRSHGSGRPGAGDGRRRPRGSPDSMSPYARYANG